MTAVDEEINLDALKLLKKIFEEADEDGSGELDIDEFCEKLGPHLGANLTREQIAQLFLKIDADAGGTVDWEEFTNFMFLEKAQTLGEGANENWRLFPQDFRDKNDHSVTHRGPVDKLYYCEVIDKYISCSRDGSFRLWNGSDIKHFRTVYLGSSWITDCIYMPQARKLVFTTVDRAISYYEANRGSYELGGRVYASGSMGVPQSLALVTNDAGEQLVYGDSKGNVVMLLCSTREWPARDLISTDEHQDYIFIHQDHQDWVSRVKWVPEVGLVSASLDSTIKVYDFVREKVINSCNHHTKAVHDFVWCRAYSMFASCGLERDVLLWQGNTMRRIGELVGHTASVTHVALDDKLNHVFTLSMDKVIKVWDLRNHKCLQTICQDDWKRSEESKPHCLMYDSTHRRVVTAMNKPYVWVHKLVAQDRTGHMDSVRGAMYNKVFAVVVSADESGTVCTWNIKNGAREGRFTKAHGDSRVTAMAFDKNQRRLLTAANDGSVRMWNFNNGSMLREYVHEEEPLEVATVIFAADEKRGADAVYAAGWNAKVFVWEELDDSDVVTEYRTYEGHREDILHMTAFPSRQLLATGDYEGRINIWNLFTGERRMSLFHRAERYETCVEKLMWLPIKKAGQTNADIVKQQVGPILLLSAGGDGLLRLWLIGSMGKLLCTLLAAQGRLEQVSAMCCDEDYNHFIIGDTAGHVRVWDIREGVNIASPEACAKSFRQRAHWRAHDASINSVDVMAGREIVIVACKDCNVSIWTFTGCCVSVLGDGLIYNLDDPESWLDPHGTTRRPPMGEMDNVYLQIDPAEQERAKAARRASRANRLSKTGQASTDSSDSDGAEDISSVQMATMIINDKRQKAREAAVTKPMGLHSMLRTHDIQHISSNVNDLLQSEGHLERKKAAKAARSVNMMLGAGAGSVPGASSGAKR